MKTYLITLAIVLMATDAQADDLLQNIRRLRIGKQQVPADAVVDDIYVTVSIAPLTSDDRTPVIFDVGSFQRIPTGGITATLDFYRSEAETNGIDWDLADLYMTDGGSGQKLPETIYITTTYTVEGVTTFNTSFPAPGHDRNLNPPGASFQELHFFLSTFVTNPVDPPVPWDPPTGLQSILVASEVRLGYFYIPEPSTLGLALWFSVLAMGRRRFT